jgi:hypothetical protein
MQGEKTITRLRRRFRETSTLILCGMILLAIGGLAPTVAARSTLLTPEIVIDPVLAKVSVGDTFMMTVNLTNFQNLFAYQVAIKYSGAILNVSSVVFNSTAGVFSGHPYAVVPEPTDMEASPDAVDGLNWIMVGSSLLGDDSVNVVNGVLCVVNFTVIGTGQTNVLIATKKSPVTLTSITFFYSNCLDSNLNQLTDFETRGCAVLSGVFNAPPVAFFTVTTPKVDNTTFLLLYQNTPPWASTYSMAWQGLPNVFNASASYAPTGSITAYIWDFGDGNITMVNATSPADAVVTHVFYTIGYNQMSLTVVSSGVNGSASMQSAPESTLILVDLALEYYDWTWLIYTFLAIVVAVVAISVAKSAAMRIRRRRAMQMEKKSITGAAAGLSQTRAKTT